MLNGKKTNKIIVLIVLTCFLSNFGLFLNEVEAAGTVIYSGYVRNASENGISGATVYLRLYEEPHPRTDRTDSNGYYSVSQHYSGTVYPIQTALWAECNGYYDSAMFGESVDAGSHTHNFKLSRIPPPPPTLSWASPADDSVVHFGPTDNIFDFSYSASNLENIKLYIGPAGSIPTMQYGGTYTTMGSSISATANLGSAVNDLDGLVRADIRGYKGGSQVLEATRNLNFSKVVSMESSLIEEGMEDFGSELYLILYDPPGDMSYSTFTEQTEVTRTNTFGLNVEIGAEVELKSSLFNVGTDAKFGVDLGYGLELEWANTDIDTYELSSSLNEDERDLVGPGYGDLYWGEREVLLWELHSTVTTYANGVVDYSDPTLYVGMDYSENILVSHQYAPDAWKQMNPNINTALYGSVVTWDIENGEFQGGTGYIESTHEKISSRSVSHEFTLGISYETKCKFGIGETTISASIETSFKHDESQTDSVKTLYHLQDGDSGDYFHYDVGTDLRFGVPIFRNTPNANPLLQSKTSTPWEHGTRDYLPPEANELDITLDTDGDGYAPSEDDTPLVEIRLVDEAEITTATIVYSNDNEQTWNTIILTERAGNPNHWFGNIPAHEHSTNISWYIFIEDSNGNSKIIRDENLENYEYTVVCRPPTVNLDSPNGGGTYKDSILIEWTGSDPDDDPLTYALAYRINSGGWRLIVQGLTNSSYVWDIRGFLDSESVSLIVYGEDGYCSPVSDESDFVFEIDNENIPEVTLVSPLSGFTYDDALTINWELVDVDEFVTGFELYYLQASGESWVLIDDSITSDILTFDWDTSTIVHSETVRLKIVALNSIDETVESISGLLTIDNRPEVQMNLINPNGGEIFTGNCSITWNVNYSDSLVTYQILLEYSNDSQVWTTIVSGINGTTYNWDTTNIDMGTNYRIRITLTGSYLGVELDSIIDISENTFVIVDETGTIAIPFFSLFALFGLVLIPLVIIKKRK